MKKLLLVVLITLGIILSGCSKDDIEPLTCSDGYILEDDQCVWIDLYPDIDTVAPYYIGSYTPTSTSELSLPDWIDDAIMYEVNLRQYTEEGTIEAFMEDLPRLQELGVEVLWFMPIHPISLENRIDTLGSYYSIQDYYDINPEFGTLEDFDNLVSTAHAMGFKIVMDVVFNHTGWDNEWITLHPEWYTQVGGEIVHPPGTNWLDVADLNFESDALVEELGNVLSYWVTEYDIDGFRCDYAGGVPNDAWQSIRDDVEVVKPDIFFLAEDNSKMDYFNVFNSNYGGWNLLGTLTRIYEGTSSKTQLETLLKTWNRDYPIGSFPLQFTTNHDINSWEGTNVSRLGSSYHLMSMLTFTLPGMPLLYSGQESSNEKQLAFFTKDLINWDTYDETDFFRELIDLKQENEALYNDNFSNSTYFLYSNYSDVFSFIRTREGSTSQVVVVANFSNDTVNALIHIDGFSGLFTDYETSEVVDLHRITNIELGAYEYKIFVSQ